MRPTTSLVFKALLPLAGVLVMAAAFRREVVESILFTPHPAIVFVIFTLAGLGALLLAFNLRHLVAEQRQFDALRRLPADQRKQALQRIAEGDSRFRSLASLLGMGAVVDRQAHQQACEAEMGRVHMAFNEALSFPGFLSGALVGLGLVGTFIGLLGALGDIAELISGLSIMGSESGNMIELFAQLVQKLQNPMKSMATAFVASLYGLVGSMTLGFMLIAQRKFAPSIIDQWRTLADELNLLRKESDIPEGSTPAENLKIALTEARQWKQLFSELREQHRQLLDSDQHLQERLAQFIQQSQDHLQDLLGRHDHHMQEMLAQQDARQEALQQHTQQQVLLIQAETRELARVLHERNETDALVRRALGEGQHWMQALMQLQETATQFVGLQQQQSALELAASQSTTSALLQLADRLERKDTRQQQELQALTQDLQRVLQQFLQLEGSAHQVSRAVVQTIETHQQALQDSTHKLRSLLAFALDEHAVSSTPVDAR